MKRLFALFLLLILFESSYSQNTDGYIITLNKDTVATKIKLPSSFFLKGYNMDTVLKVVINEETKKLTPRDILGFGYTLKSKNYDYRVKPIKEGSLYFLRIIIAGPNTNLYQYAESNNGPGEVYAPQEFYTFERSDGTFMFTNNYVKLKTFKTKLKEFYKDYDSVLPLIDQNFNTRPDIQRDIKKILEAVNIY